MTDREMLQLAAKAAGVELQDDHYWRDGFWTRWNPLTDDGDAFRLADKLQLNVDFCCYRVVRGTKIDVLEDVENRRAAIRRAIVRAAAEIGKAMP
jgi:hypothetical protein